MGDRTVQSLPATPLWAVNGLTFLASIGTGVVWNGVSFIAEHEYHFSRSETLRLYLVLGVVYVAGALSTGPMLRRLGRWWSPRAMLALVLAVEALICTGPLFFAGPWMLWVVACVNSLLSSWLWPIVESYMTAGRHGPAMRSAIGWWNLCWTTATALSLVMMAPMMQEQPQVIAILGREVVLSPRKAIVILGALNAFALVMLPFFQRKPGAHDEQQSHAAIQPEYPMLLRAARMLLPLSYVLNSAMSPLVPYLLEGLQLDSMWRTPVTSTWMWVRIIAMALMWRMGYWHGRWGTLLLGGLAMTLGFGMVVTNLSLPIVLVGLGVFGAGMGVVYYAALYYAMAVGRAEVDAGGTHEALIGVGYAVGPTAGLLGLALAQSSWNGVFGRPENAVVAVVWGLVGLCAIGAARPYIRARKVRGRSADPRAAAEED